MSLKEMVTEGKAAMAKENQELSILRQEYNAMMDKHLQIITPIENRHKQLVSKFISYINNEIIEDCCDNCRPKLFERGVFTSDGITIWDDADHPYDIREVDYTWEEVEEVLTKIGELK